MGKRAIVFHRTMGALGETEEETLQLWRSCGFAAPGAIKSLRLPWHLLEWNP